MLYVKSYQFPDLEKIAKVTNYFLGKESYILKKYDFVSDYNTGLTAAHVTTRSNAYSVMDFVEECPEIQDIFNFVRTSYWHYIDNVFPNKTFTNDQIDPALSIWLNIIREDESIGTHRHSDEYELWSFVSGTMALSVEDTSTCYLHKINNSEDHWNQEGEIVKNVPGLLTFFPPYLYHWTTNHLSTNPRVTFGLDVLFNKSHAEGSGTFYDTLKRFNA